MLAPLLGLTLFVSAFLLFWCQPMTAKMMLPALGGSASVWKTCVLFFQTMLLGGYVYAHLLARRFRLRNQLFVHVALMLTVLVFLPIQFGVQGPAAGEEPVAWLLLQLLATIGVPFFAVSTTAPLLQNWLAQTKTESGRDPYFLYASSNAGSLLALVLYPLLVEPRLGLAAQTDFWTGAYLLLIVMVVTGAVLVWKRSMSGTTRLAEKAPPPPPDNRTRLYWLAAACVPSALMLAVTSHISTNLASVPFLWIIPLALYLLTFILAFGKRVPLAGAHLSRLAPGVLLLFLPIVPDMAPLPAGLNWFLMSGHLALLFFGAYLCHTSLAARRPDPHYLTEFYFWIALGGALGGVFSAIIAPAIFSTVLEYPLLVALLPFFRQAGSREPKPNRWDLIYAAVLGVAFFTTWYIFRAAEIDPATVYAAPDVVFFILVFLFSTRWLRFAAGFAVLAVGYALTIPELVERGDRLYVARDFFGVKKVLFDEDQNLRKLLHGDTLHGVESQDPAKSGQPLSYYHPDGPVGDVMELISTRPTQTVGVVGLGTGTMAAYGGPNRRVVFFDVDQQVESIAMGYFTFVRRCAANCEIVISDGRLGIDRSPVKFDVLMLDAFSSDSIPTHLVTREAIHTYMARLKPGGLLLFHVSNRYLNVDKLVAAVVADAGLMALYRSDRGDTSPGKSGSDYIVAAKRSEDFGRLDMDLSWRPLPASADVLPWTDDYSNMLALMKWK